MFGEPADVDGECNACLFIADNYGDGSATMRCQLPLGHDGVHREEFTREGSPVTITWVVDERKKCDHGCGQWRHNHRDRHYYDEGQAAIVCPKDADDHEFSDCAYCHPDQESKTCTACGKAYYYERGHKRHCPKEPYTCKTCGESGVGPHVWPSCPKERETTPSAGELP